MRSKQRRGSIARFILLLSISSLSAFSGRAHAAGKTKPDLPLGEESYEPSPSTKKPIQQNTEQRAAASQAITPAKKQDPLATPPENHGDNKATSAHDSSASSSGHSPAAPHSTQNSSEETSSPKQGESTQTAPVPAQGEESHSPAAESAHGEEGKLLEGKVPPATPEKGSGFIWFGVVFVLLAIAIFVFT